jgi:anti-sigma-K factor RskA
MTQDARTAHALSGAYALDALSEHERHRFEAHLAECDSCAQEVRGLQETAARLAAAVAQPPPPRLRDRVLAEAAQVRQLPPSGGWSGPSRGLPTRLLLVAAAACLVIAVVLGVGLVRTQNRLDRVQADQREVSQVLSAGDARTLTARVRTGGTGTVVISPRLNKAVVFLAGLPALPANRSYELWLMAPGAVRPAGLLTPVSPPAVLNIGAAARIGLTVEPAGGSAQPTTDPIFLAELPV